MFDIDVNIFQPISIHVAIQELEDEGALDAGHLGGSNTIYMMFHMWRHQRNTKSMWKCILHVKTTTEFANDV